MTTHTNTKGLDPSSKALNAFPPEFVADNYMPVRLAYLKEKSLAVDLDTIARNAANLVGLMTGMLRSKYFDYDADTRLMKGRLKLCECM
jgi:hypothetical protein